MRIKTVLAAIAASFVLSAPLFASVQPADEKKTEPQLKETAAAPGKVVFDASHGEIFSPVKKGPLNYTDFSGSLKKKGAEVSQNSGKVTLQSLAGVKTYVIAGPTKPLGGDEASAILDFVENGGNLLILLHISPPVAELTESFGILVTNFVISEPEGTIKGKSQDFYVTRFTKHPVTGGLKKLAVYGTWGLMAEQGAEVVASTSEKAWADTNRNRAFDKDEPVQAFGIVAVKTHGKGKVAVVADDAPFANQFFKEADNRKLADNIMRWFGN